MKARALHRCIHVLDLEKSLKFYKEALGLTVVHRIRPVGNAWEIVFIANDENGFQLELTWNEGRVEPYDNGGRDTHLCFAVDDIEQARALHESMGCVCFVNKNMGLYFIEDPDGCWIEIVQDNERNRKQPGVDVLAALSRRRSLRAYTDERIPEDLLAKVTRAGLLSAAGRGIRPWELVIVRNRETLQALAGMREGHAAKMLESAGAAIVVVANTAAADTWVEDCSIVMANMHLAADALGLGSCWVQGRMRTAPDGRSASDYVRDLLGIPEGFELEATLALGYPDQRKPARSVDDALLAKVHVEKF